MVAGDSLRSTEIGKKKRGWLAPQRQKMGSEPNFVFASLRAGQAAFLNWDLTPISVFATFLIAPYAVITPSKALKAFKLSRNLRNSASRRLCRLLPPSRGYRFQNRGILWRILG